MTQTDSNSTKVFYKVQSRHRPDVFRVYQGDRYVGQVALRRAATPEGVDTWTAWEALNDGGYADPQYFGTRAQAGEWLAR